jgi:hypothetical protein
MGAPPTMTLNNGVEMPARSEAFDRDIADA